MELHKSKSTIYVVVFVIGIIFVGFNLRPAITSIGPLIGIIQDDLNLPHWSMGLLTSLPLIAFALCSPIVPRFARRFTNTWAMIMGLVLIFLGIFVRVIPSVLWLYTGTIIVGIGIAICNVLLPVVVKENFPEKVGLMTSVYSTSIGIFASLASGVSVPLAVDLQLGWNQALLVWLAPVVIAIIIWFYISKFNKSKQTGTENLRESTNRMWKSLLAWQVALFFGFQSTLFYITVTWLPEILIDKGISLTTAGWLLSFTQLIGLPASFIVPIIAGRLSSQKWLAALLGLMAITGYLGLLVWNSTGAIIASLILIGFPLSGSFALSLVYIGIRARDAKDAAELSGMAQSFGYLISAVGPIFIGFLFDYSESWTMPLVTLIIISGFVLLFGMSAGRNKFV